MKTWNLAALMRAALACASCATIIRGAKTDFTVNSEPQGALVTLSTGEVCNATPCVFRNRPRNQAFTVTVEMDGYRTSTTEIGHHWSRRGTTTGIVGNAILGGGIGIGIDAATGANQDLFPNPLLVSLERDTPAVAAPAAAS